MHVAAKLGAAWLVSICALILAYGRSSGSAERLLETVVADAESYCAKADEFRRVAADPKQTPAARELAREGAAIHREACADARLDVARLSAAMDR